MWCAYIVVMFVIVDRDYCLKEGSRRPTYMLIVMHFNVIFYSFVIIIKKDLNCGKLDSVCCCYTNKAGLYK